MVVIATVLLVRAHRVQRSWIISPSYVAYPGIGMQQAVQSITEQLKTVAPTIPNGARILFLNDPFGREYYTLTYICQLLYRDPAVVVERSEVLGNVPASRYGEYDLVLRFEGRSLRVVSGETSPVDPEITR